GFAAEGPSDAKEAINEVFDYLIRYHKDNPGVKQLMEGAIWGMIQTLDDPYTVYLSRDEMKQFMDDMSGDFSGVGIYLEAGPDYPLITEVISDSLILSTTLLSGDLIKKVDGADVRKMPLNKVVERIKGPSGTQVELVLEREGREISLKMKRAALSAATVSSKIVGNNAGYVAVKSFGVKTPQEFTNSLKEMNSKKITALVIDLRDNPGGYFKAAIDMAGHFLDKGKLVVSTKDYEGSVEHFRVTDNSKIVNVPVVILVNSGSASASEIFAGALQDNGAAILVGDTTYGKGVVQNLISLDEGGALKVTTSEYTTPKGRHIHQQGLKPDYMVSTGELQLPFALKLLQPQQKRVLKFTPGSNEVLLDGEKIRVSGVPVISGETVYLPLRFTFEALGYVVSWEPESGSIVLNGQGRRIVIPRSGHPTVNGAEIMVSSGVIGEDVSYISTGLINAMKVSTKSLDGQIIIEG
ncbi:MAG: S41 family peptidase, partial [Firmicutes bacterium]|nr:S41 family peptidase [Bacillota bacterium]